MINPNICTCACFVCCYDMNTDAMMRKSNFAHLRVIHDRAYVS